MKKALILLTTALLLGLIFLCSCGPTQKTLNTPQGLIVNNGKLYWQSVDGANSYIVMISGIEQPQTSTTQFDLSTANLQDGQAYTLQVKAVGNENNTLSSAYSVAIAYTHSTDTNNDNNNDNNNNNNNNNNNGSSNTSKPVGLYNIQTDEPDGVSQFTMDTNLLGDRIASSYWDGEYNYYLVYMGTVKTTPIATGIAGYYNGNNDATITFSKAVTEEESTTDIIHTIERELTSVKASVDVGIGSFVKAGVEAYYENEKTTDTAHEVTKNVGKTIQSDITYTVKSGATGFYRIALYSFCDAYYVIKTNEDRTELLEYSLTLCPYEDQCYTMLEYMGDTNSKKTYNIEKNQLENPENFFKSLPMPKNDMVNMKVDNIIPNTGTSNTATISDSGSYGMNCPDATKTKLKLDSYSKLFSKEFMFRFTVKINLSEKDDGYQEIYLYNKYNEPTSKSFSIHELQLNKGLVSGAIIEHLPGSTDTSSKDYTITWCVSGDKVSEVMYIVYDAYGQRGDTLYRNDITVTLDIVGGVSTKKAGSILSNKTSLEISDNGEYGNNAKLNKDKIIIDQKYYEYKQDNYVFMLDMNITMREKDDGYQEVFLYSTTPTGAIENIKDAISKGMLGAFELCHTPGDKNNVNNTYNFQWYLTGDQIPNTNTLYIAYDAHGDGGDTWYREEIKCELYIYTFDTATKNSENVRLFYFMN